MTRRAYSHVEPQYIDRVELIASTIVCSGSTPQTIKAELDRHRDREGDRFGNDLRDACAQRWRSLGFGTQEAGPVREVERLRAEVREQNLEVHALADSYVRAIPEDDLPHLIPGWPLQFDATTCEILRRSLLLRGLMPPLHTITPPKVGRGQVLDAADALSELRLQMAALLNTIDGMDPDATAARLLDGVLRAQAALRDLDHHHQSEEDNERA